ncbi:phenylalanine--tRNA ligase subunit beta [Coxiella endosymbiont of Amblyomma nuttalli]|uniref:phenylalanine--tRNA ligase subunit beta n=1 Tax=Coxiella endosymbiont of Amblyomma nuttalli TaxID=2749996 RepID=UPI001BA4BD57|nr:phenylalanine--tRNA ligase subunit beta [Coxiella endosymbiont of Amblyomma nuttalli]QTS84113.1 Phenylalanine--tRNA ligase beta subunit [Coxiella endosymbiont of Amblyomma nuttalli]
MKFSETWLREWVNLPIDTEQLVKQLTMSGLEVNSVQPVARHLEKVVIGKVISKAKHPNVNELSCYQVDVGEHEPLKIICSAPNVRVNLKVAVVLVGGRVGDRKIKKTKLCGVTSDGMICSERELGLCNDSADVMELPSDAPIGKDVCKYLQLNDHIIEIGLTPNRGDCASLRGIARELSSINQLLLRTSELITISPTINEIFPVNVEATKACPRYLGRIIRNINSGVSTPLWMCERLRRSGFHAMHPVVNITNYVMLELGQPIYSFDWDRLSGGIEVRFAKSNEKIILISEAEVKLNEHTLIIADKNQPKSIAGIMGNLESAVSEKTKHIFLESAYFSPSNIALTARRYNMHTNSSYRFERGVDFELQILAMERVSKLLLSIVGGEAGPIVEKCTNETLPKISTITLRRKRIKHLLGIEINDNEIQLILELLGMTVVKYQKGWQVTIPSYRFDITQEVDLIEELARLKGYEQIPPTSMKRSLTVPPLLKEQHVNTARIRHLMVDRGYHEIITYSFVSDKIQYMLNPGIIALQLANPITHDMNVMRNSLWPGLIAVLKYNQAHQIQRVRIFEIGRCFFTEEGERRQITKLGGLVFGSVHSPQWGQRERLADFYDLKGDLSALISLTRADFCFVQDNHPALHPGQCAAIYREDRCFGYLGALHPTLVRELGLTRTPYLFEIELKAIETAMLPRYEALSKFPMIQRDITVIVDWDIEVASIEKEIVKNAGQLLIMTEIFDIYKDAERIEFGKKSVSLRLTFQDSSRTLRDEEINQVIERIVVKLRHRFNATLRT